MYTERRERQSLVAEHHGTHTHTHTLAARPRAIPSRACVDTWRSFRCPLPLRVLSQAARTRPLIPHLPIQHLHAHRPHLHPRPGARSPHISPSVVRSSLIWTRLPFYTLAQPTNRYNPGCYSTLYDWLLPAEVFNEKECPDDDLWPCRCARILPFACVCRRLARLEIISRLVRPPPDWHPTWPRPALTRFFCGTWARREAPQHRPAFFSPGRLSWSAHKWKAEALNPEKHKVTGALSDLGQLPASHQSTTAGPGRAAGGDAAVAAAAAAAAAPVVAGTSRLPSSRTVVVGQRGEACEEACARYQPGLRCHLHGLSALNTCDVLREHRIDGCNGGCDVSRGVDQPAYVDAKAPAESRPNACLVNSGELSCEGKHPLTSRLCACA